MVSFLWTQLQDIGPSARYGHGLAYDAERRRTLLVGGDAGGALLHDTWLWDGKVWTQVEDIGPSGRAGHAVAYDSARQRVVLFGGRNSAAPLPDTWEWDGEAWTQVEDTGPSARSRHALAYDSARSRVVLFGGEDAALGLLGDTWEWDGDEWTQVADTGPSPRAGHAMCFEAPSTRTVLFGGSSGSDSWAWSGTLWTKLNDVGPAPCDGTALVFTGQSILLFGGIDTRTTPPTLYRLTWELAASDWTERQDMGPAHRFGHALAYDRPRARVVMFGGAAAPPAAITPSDLFSDTWELPAGGAPPAPPTDAEVTLVSFDVVTDAVSSTDTFTISVGLDRPAPTSVEVDISLPDTAFVGGIPIFAGQMSSEGLLNATVFGLQVGKVYVFSATLGAVTLQATRIIL